MQRGVIEYTCFALTGDAAVDPDIAPSDSKVAQAPMRENSSHLVHVADGF